MTSADEAAADLCALLCELGLALRRERRVPVLRLALLLQLDRLASLGAEAETDDRSAQAQVI